MTVAIPDLDDLATLLDFKKVLEEAVANVFTGAGISNVTSSKAKYFDPESPSQEPKDADKEFTLPVPRVEIKVVPSSGNKQGFGIMVVAGKQIPFCTTYKANLSIRAITSLKAEGKLTHSAYRALILFIGTTLPLHINKKECGLLYHEVRGPIALTGSSDIFHTKDGFEFSMQDFEFDFTVNPNALSTLTT